MLLQEKIIIITAYTDGSHGTEQIDIRWIHKIIGDYPNIELKAFNIFGSNRNQSSDYCELMLGHDYTSLLNHVSSCLGRPIVRPDWARVGFFRFKPRLIRQAQETSPVGSLIIWIDANQKKYPEYRDLLSSLIKQRCAVLQGNDLLVFNESVASDFSIQCDSGRFHIPNLEKMSKFPIVWAGCIVLRNNHASKGIIEEWDQLCSRTRNLIPMIISQRPVHKNLVVHAQEQVLLSIVVYTHLRASPLYVKPVYKTSIRMLLLPGSRRFPLGFKSLKGILSTIVKIIFLDMRCQAKISLMQNLLVAVIISLYMWPERLKTSLRTAVNKIFKT